MREPRGFHGQVLDHSRQRQLYRRWSEEDDVHPHEAFVGLAALLRGASILELRFLGPDEQLSKDDYPDADWSDTTLKPTRPGKCGSPASSAVGT